MPNAANAAEVLGPAGRRGAAPGVTVDRPARRGRRPRRAGTAVAAGARAARPARRAGLHVVRDRHRGAAAPRSPSAAPATPASTATSCWSTPTAAGELWDAVLEAGQDLGIRPCGLGARDTLRTEMGYPLHGHELSREITPDPGARRLGGRLEEAGVLGPRGAARREGGRPAPAAVGPAGRPAAASRGRAWPCSTPPARAVGEVTSGTFSPTLRTGIALALIDAAAGVAEGDRARRRRPRPPAGGRGRQAAVRRRRTCAERPGRSGVLRGRVAVALLRLRVTRAACRPSSRRGRPSAAARPSWCRARSGARSRS